MENTDAREFDEKYLAIEMNPHCFKFQENIMKKNHAIAAAVLVATTFLGGCASPDYQPISSQQPYPTSAQSYSNAYGVIDSIQQVNSSGNNVGITPGTVIGGIVGGVLGNLVGGGIGNKVATGAGAVGGALIGNQIEQRNKPQSAMYQIGLRLDNGSYQTVTQPNVADLSIGSRVRVENGHVYRN